MRVLFVPSGLAAQEVGARLQGVVTDAGGGAIAAATILVLSAETGAARELETDSAGRYDVPLLPPGTYEICAAARGLSPRCAAVCTSTSGRRWSSTSRSKWERSVQRLQLHSA